MMKFAGLRQEEPEPEQLPFQPQSTVKTDQASQPATPAPAPAATPATAASGARKFANVVLTLRRSVKTVDMYACGQVQCMAR